MCFAYFFENESLLHMNPTRDNNNIIVRISYVYDDDHVSAHKGSSVGGRSARNVINIYLLSDHDQIRIDRNVPV